MSKTLDELKVEHGRVASATLGGTTYYFRKPTMGEYQRLQERMAKDDSNFAALREVAGACSVGDDPVAAFSEYPAAVAQIGLKLLEMAGSEVEVLISKD